MRRTQQLIEKKKMREGRRGGALSHAGGLQAVHDRSVSVAVETPLLA